MNTRRQMQVSVIFLSLLFFAGCSSFGTTKDRWTDRYETQAKIMDAVSQMHHERLEYLTALLANLDGESRGMLIALIAMNSGTDYRDYADVLAAVTPPDRTSGEIIAQGVSDVLPLAASLGAIGWMTNTWSDNSVNGGPMTDNRVSYKSGGDMGFGSWNPSTVTTTTTPTPVIVGP